MSWEDKCSRSDVILRGVVVDLIQLTGKVDDSRGSSNEKITDKNFEGPNAVAVVRVTEVFKSMTKAPLGIIFIPCGYDFDESPAELTKTKDYFLFLSSMGRNYFHPMDYCSTHRVQHGLVNLSGLDSDSDFEEGRNKDGVSNEEFVKRIREALRQVGTQKSDKEAGFMQKTYRVPDDYRWLLAKKAFEKTGNPEFEPPEKKEGHTIIWEPAPSVLIKTLGLDFRE